MAKVTLHIPVEQYGYVEVESAEISIEKVAEVYNDFKSAFAAKPEHTGLSRKDWNECLDALNMGLPCKIEHFEAMSPKQKEFYHEQEKSIARLKNKLADNNNEE